MSANRRCINLLPILVAVGIAAFFRYDPDTQLASHLLASIADTGSSVIETDGNAVIVGMNRNTEELTGYQRKEMIGRSLTDFMVDKAKSSHPKKFKEAEISMTIVRCAMRRKDGSLTNVVINARIGRGRYIATIVPESLVIDHYTR